jgi:hypothetical protein
MLATPIGLLSVSGLESVMAALTPRRRRHADPVPALRKALLRSAPLLVAFVLLVPSLAVPLTLLRAPDQGLRVRFGLSETARIIRGQNLPPEDSRPEAAAALVSGRITPGEQIYVLGDPRIMTLLRAVQGAEVSGWTTQLPPSVWTELGRELNRARPRYIYVDGRDWSDVDTGLAASVFTLIAKHYRPVAKSVEGTWYETAHPGKPLPEPGGNHLFSPPPSP